MKFHKKTWGKDRGWFAKAYGSWYSYASALGMIGEKYDGSIVFQVVLNQLVVRGVPCNAVTPWGRVPSAWRRVL